MPIARSLSQEYPSSDEAPSGRINPRASSSRSSVFSSVSDPNDPRNNNGLKNSSHGGRKMGGGIVGVDASSRSSIFSSLTEGNDPKRNSNNNYNYGEGRKTHFNNSGGVDASRRSSAGSLSSDGFRDNPSPSNLGTNPPPPRRLKQTSLDSRSRSVGGSMYSSTRSGYSRRTSFGSEIFHDAQMERLPSTRALMPHNRPPGSGGPNGAGGRSSGGGTRQYTFERQASIQKSFRHAAGHFADEPAYDSYDGESLEDIGWFRTKCGEVVDDERIQLFILILIAVNSIMIGAATIPEVVHSPRIAMAFDIVDLVVLVIFTIESLVQVIYHGTSRFLKDGWLVFDFLIVIISWISIEVESLQAFRVLRALRFVTQVAILRNVVVALLSIVPSIAAIFTLLLLIFYIFAVMFTTLFKDLYADGHTGQDYFGRMDLTLFTLFQFLCLDEWSGVAYEVAEVYYWSWIIFVAFVVMSAFVVVNLLIAVICDALQILRTAEVTMLEQGLYGMEDKEDDDEQLHDGTAEGGEHPSPGGGESEMRRKVLEMQRMLDEMAATQEGMARTIQHLSLALYAERKADDLGSIREANAEESSQRGSVPSDEKSSGSNREGEQVAPEKRSLVFF